MEFKGKTVFISGPMTGKPGYNFKAFDEWERRINEAGGGAVNPARISRQYKAEKILEHGEEFKEMVERQLAELYGCDTILLLDGWEKSSGVRAELKAALEGGLEIVLENGIA